MSTATTLGPQALRQGEGAVGLVAGAPRALQGQGAGRGQAEAGGPHQGTVQSRRGGWEAGQRWEGQVRCTGGVSLHTWEALLFGGSDGQVHTQEGVKG